MKTHTEADMARAWQAGHRWCYDGGGEADNPYKKKADPVQSPNKTPNPPKKTPCKEISK